MASSRVCQTVAAEKGDHELCCPVVSLQCVVRVTPATSDHHDLPATAAGITTAEVAAAAGSGTDIMPRVVLKPPLKPGGGTDPSAKSAWGSPPSHRPARNYTK